MSNKLIDLNALSAYKTSSDAKYQDKLTAGAGITLSSNTISASVTPTYGSTLSGSRALAGNTIGNLGEITLQPGKYFIMYACQFSSNSNGTYRQCGFSTSATDLSGFGWAFMDSQAAVNGAITQTMVSGVFEISASEYPNGQTFYFLAKHDKTGTGLTVYPRAYYLKFE